MDEQRREVTQHIEFESNRWLKSFQLTIQLTRTIPMVGASFSARERDAITMGNMPDEIQTVGRLPAQGRSARPHA